MDKIKALLEKAGCKPELSDQICDVLERYKTTLREGFEAEYTAKTEKARQICIEETEAYKRNLARRVQTFCETKGAAVEAAIAKQSALGEAAAVTRLKQIRSMMEGIEPNGAVNGQTTADNNRLKQKLKAVTEERNVAITKANRQTALSEKLLKRNRELEVKVRSARPPVTETRQPVRRLDTQRGGGQAQTTRPTILENQTRRPAAQPKSTFGVQDIAAQMDDVI